jgi:hypothetical protein
MNNARQEQPANPPSSLLTLGFETIGARFQILRPIAANSLFRQG